MNVKLLFGTLICSAAAVLSAADVYLAGDSTCATYPAKRAPLTGWGQQLAKRAKADCKVVNCAVSGRSTKSFREGGNWAKMMKQVKAGDFVLIQFAHNNRAKKDPKRYTTFEEFREQMTAFVKEVKAAKANPVLVTPIEERKFKNGKFIAGRDLKKYSQIIIEVAKAENVPVVDINAATWEWINKLGDEASRKYYMAGSGLPGKERDNTHLSFDGANIVADMFLTLSEKTELPVRKCFK